MNKRMWLAGLIVGQILVCFSFVLPLIAAGVSCGASGPDVAIIGGADASSFDLVFGIVFRKLFWLRLIGAVLAVLAALQLHKK